MKNITLTIFILFFTFTSFASIGVIHGDSSLCAGQTTAFTDTTVGGVWHSNDTAIGIIDSSTGIFTAVAAGATVITYTSGSSYVTTIVFVNSLPTPVFGLGADSICKGETIPLYDTTPGGGQWTAGPVFTILDSTSNSVSILGSGSGYGQVTFTDTSGCTASIHIFVNAATDVITGTTTIHVGGTTTLSDFPGGIWGSMDTSIATVGRTTGIVTGISMGSATIYYETYCGSVITTVTVLPPVDVPVTKTYNSAIAIYPNPANTQLMIQAPDKIARLCITDMLGQLIITHHCNAEQVQINVSQLPAGVYFIKINGLQAGKFVKE